MISASVHTGADIDALERLLHGSGDDVPHDAGMHRADERPVTNRRGRTDGYVGSPGG